MQTCRHFRNQLPRELADELRDADSEPCPVCDAMPHRQYRMRVASRLTTVQVARAVSPTTDDSGWLAGVLTFLHRRRA